MSDKVIKLAKEFEKRLEKEAWNPLALAGGGILAVLPTAGGAMLASSIINEIRQSIPEFSSAKEGVKKAVNLASKFKVKTNQAVIDRFIKNGNTIIPLFDVMQNIEGSGLNQQTVDQLDSFIRKVSEFINDAYAIEQVIKENSTWYEKAGYKAEQWFGLGLRLTNLKSFNDLIQQLTPALSLTLSNASAIYNKIMEEVNKVTQEQPEEEPTTKAPVTKAPVTKAPAAKPHAATSELNELFESFA
jgi:hypothetical protein